MQNNFLNENNESYESNEIYKIHKNNKNHKNHKIHKNNQYIDQPNMNNTSFLQTETNTDSDDLDSNIDNKIDKVKKDYEKIKYRIINFWNKIY